jgi:hypothetical protein
MRTRKRGEKILFFDEFAVCNRPNTYYGWAEKNTRPQVPSDESNKREKLNGLLAVDAVSGEEFLRLVPTAKTEDLALYFGELCKDCIHRVNALKFSDVAELMYDIAIESKIDGK